MRNKWKILCGFVILIFLIIVALIVFYKKTSSINTYTNIEPNVNKQEIKKEKNIIKQSKLEQPTNNKSDNIKTLSVDLKNYALFKSIPFDSYLVFEKLDEDTKNDIISKINIYDDIYFIKNDNHKIYILKKFIENENYIRHPFELIEYDLNSKVVSKSTFNIGDDSNDNNDEWDTITKDNHLLIQHKKYNNKKKKDIDYIEYWTPNTNTTNIPIIEYELKDEKESVISLRKKTFNDNHTQIEENIFYDDGNIISNIFITLNQQDEIISFISNNNVNSIFNLMYNCDFQNNLKTKEEYYDNYKLTKYYEFEYNNKQTLEQIKLFDENKNLIQILKVE